MRTLLTMFISMFLFGVIAVPESNAAFALSEKTITWRHVDLSSGLRTNAAGYPKIDRTKVDLNRVTSSEFKAISLENDYVRVMLLPEMGRVISLFDKVAGHEVLWTNQVARPLFGQQNELEWWMVWGGVEYTIPAGEHGTTWALPWRSTITENSATRKAVRMTVFEPGTKLEQTVEISLEWDYAGFRTDIAIRNTSEKTVRFSHWVNPMWAPGGLGAITPNTEFIVPTAEVKVPPRDFNAWMLGKNIQPWPENPLRFIENWRSIGDLLALELTNGFYGAFSHDKNHGVVRIFDHQANPGMDIWTWGFQPSRERQADYSLTPNAGYVEMWGGTVQDFTEGSLKSLGPRERIELTEWMAPFRATKGLTTATRDLAVRFCYTGSTRSTLELAVCPLRTIPDASIEVSTAAGQKLISEKVALKPDAIFSRTLEVAGDDRTKLTLVISSNSKQLLRSEGTTSMPVRFGMPFLPKAQ